MNATELQTWAQAADTSVRELRASAAHGDTQAAGFLAEAEARAADLWTRYAAAAAQQTTEAPTAAPATAAPITYRKIAAGHYVHDETGVQLRLAGNVWTAYRPTADGQGEAFAGAATKKDLATDAAVAIAAIRAQQATPAAEPAAPVRDNYRGHGTPATAVYYGRGTRPTPTGTPVTLAPTGMALAIRDAATGKTIEQPGITAKLWLTLAAQEPATPGEHAAVAAAASTTPAAGQAWQLVSYDTATATATHRMVFRTPHSAQRALDRINADPTSTDGRPHLVRVHPAATWVHTSTTTEPVAVIPHALADRVTWAAAAGTLAYEQGRPDAPGADSTVRALINGMPVGTGGGRIMEAFSTAYRALADAAAEAVLTAPDAPPAAPVQWAGRTLGQLTPAERDQVTTEACAVLKKELERPALAAALLADLPTPAPTAEVVGAGADRAHYCGACHGWHISQEQSAQCLGLPVHHPGAGVLDGVVRWTTRAAAQAAGVEYTRRMDATSDAQHLTDDELRRALTAGPGPALADIYLAELGARLAAERLTTDTDSETTVPIGCGDQVSAIAHRTGQVVTGYVVLVLAPKRAGRATGYQLQVEGQARTLPAAHPVRVEPLIWHESPAAQHDAPMVLVKASHDAESAWWELRRADVPHGTLETFDVGEWDVPAAQRWAATAVMGRLRGWLHHRAPGGAQWWTPVVVP